MKQKKILILGGTGFIGSALAESLTKCGHIVTVPTRQRERAKHLLLLPTCDVIEANVRDGTTLNALVDAHDVVINLIGILHGDFEAVHVAFPTMVATSCARRVRDSKNIRLLHMSAINADANGPSEYLRSRGRGEDSVKKIAAETGLAVTIFRPSVVFGEGDNFLNMFAKLVAVFPVMPLGSPNATFQVVWVADVVRAFTRAIDMPETIGKTYPLVGPDVYTLRELIEFVIKLTRANCLVIGLGSTLTNLQARVFGRLPGKLITPDNVASMTLPNISHEPFPAVFGAPSAMHAVVSTYMKTPQGRGRYPRFRDRAGR
jgi:uncharacterized protein YbjT (DUF2867 family)